MTKLEDLALVNLVVCSVALLWCWYLFCMC